MPVIGKITMFFIQEYILVVRLTNNENGVIANHGRFTRGVAMI
jgi:hypothetical protein